MSEAQGRYDQEVLAYLGRLIGDARKARKLSLQDLSDVMAQRGVMTLTASHLQQIERGTSATPAYRLAYLGELLDIPLLRALAPAPRPSLRAAITELLPQVPDEALPGLCAMIEAWTQVCRSKSLPSSLC